VRISSLPSLSIAFDPPSSLWSTDRTSPPRKKRRNTVENEDGRTVPFPLPFGSGCGSDGGCPPSPRVRRPLFLLGPSSVSLPSRGKKREREKGNGSFLPFSQGIETPPPHLPFGKEEEEGGAAWIVEEETREGNQDLLDGHGWHRSLDPPTAVLNPSHPQRTHPFASFPSSSPRVPPFAQEGTRGGGKEECFDPRLAHASQAVCARSAPSDRHARQGGSTKHARRKGCRGEKKEGTRRSGIGRGNDRGNARERKEENPRRRRNVVRGCWEKAREHHRRRGVALRMDTTERRELTTHFPTSIDPSIHPSIHPSHARSGRRRE